MEVEIKKSNEKKYVELYIDEFKKGKGKIELKKMLFELFKIFSTKLRQKAPDEEAFFMGDVKRHSKRIKGACFLPCPLATTAMFVP